jgi:hypothetical protein
MGTGRETVRRVVGDDGHGWNWQRGWHRIGGIHGVRLWVGMDRGHSDGGRHDSIGTGRQTGGGETGAEATVCDRGRDTEASTLGAHRPDTLASRSGSPGPIPNGSGPRSCVGQARFTSFSLIDSSAKDFNLSSSKNTMCELCDVPKFPNFVR